MFGIARLGAVIKYIPNPVIAGFTAGIAVIIFVGQWKDFLGLSSAPAGLRPPEAVVAHRSLADHQPGDHRFGAARARDFDLAPAT